MPGLPVRGDNHGFRRQGDLGRIPEIADEEVSIPILGDISSLNVSVAAECYCMKSSANEIT